MRKITQIAATPAGLAPRAIYALCDDHTLWLGDTARSGWTQLAPIPQPPPVDPTRACVSCIYRGDLDGRSHCDRLQDHGTDPVSGAKLKPTVLCKDERASEGGCGPEGKFWALP